MPRQTLFDDGDFWRFERAHRVKCSVAPAKSSRNALGANSPTVAGDSELPSLPAAMGSSSYENRVSEAAFAAHQLRPVLQRYNQKSALFRKQKQQIGRQFQARRQRKAVAKISSVLADTNSYSASAASPEAGHLFLCGESGAPNVPRKLSCHFVVYSRCLDDVCASTGVLRAGSQKHHRVRPWRRTRVWVESIARRATSAQAILHWTYDDVEHSRRNLSADQISSSALPSAGWDNYFVVKFGSSVQWALPGELNSDSNRQADIPGSIKRPNCARCIVLSGPCPIALLPLDEATGQTLFDCLRWATCNDEGLRAPAIELTSSRLVVKALVDVSPHLVANGNTSAIDASAAAHGAEVEGSEELHDIRLKPEQSSRGKAATAVLPTSRYIIQVEFGSSRSNNDAAPVAGRKFRSKPVKLRGNPPPKVVAIVPTFSVVVHDGYGRADTPIRVRLVQVTAHNRLVLVAQHRFRFGHLAFEPRTIPLFQRDRRDDGSGAETSFVPLCRLLVKLESVLPASEPSEGFSLSAQRLLRQASEALVSLMEHTVQLQDAWLATTGESQLNMSALDSPLSVAETAATALAPWLRGTPVLSTEHRDALRLHSRILLALSHAYQLQHIASLPMSLLRRQPASADHGAGELTDHDRNAVDEAEPLARCADRWAEAARASVACLRWLDEQLCGTINDLEQVVQSVPTAAHLELECKVWAATVQLQCGHLYDARRLDEDQAMEALAESCQDVLEVLRGLANVSNQAKPFASGDTPGEHFDIRGAQVFFTNQVEACAGNFERGFTDARRFFHDTIIPHWTKVCGSHATNTETNSTTITLSGAVGRTIFDSSGHNVDQLLRKAPPRTPGKNSFDSVARPLPTRAAPIPPVSRLDQDAVSACRRAAQNLRDLDLEGYGLGESFGLVNSQQAAAVGSAILRLREATAGTVDAKFGAHGLPALSTSDTFTALQCELDALIVLCRASLRQFLSLGLPALSPSANVPGTAQVDNVTAAREIGCQAREAADAAVESLRQLKMAMRLDTTHVNQATTRTTQLQLVIDTVICAALHACSFLELRRTFLPGDAASAEVVPVDTPAEACASAIAHGRHLIMTELNALDELALLLPEAFNRQARRADIEPGDEPFDTRLKTYVGNVRLLLDQASTSAVPAELAHSESQNTDFTPGQYAAYVDAIGQLNAMHAQTVALLAPWAAVLPALAAAIVIPSTQRSRIYRSVSSLQLVEPVSPTNVREQQIHRISAAEKAGEASLPANPGEDASMTHDKRPHKSAVGTRPEGDQDSEDLQPPTLPPRSAKNEPTFRAERGDAPDSDDSHPPTPPPRTTKPTLQRGAVLDDSSGRSLPTHASQKEPAIAEPGPTPGHRVLVAQSSGERHSQAPRVEQALDENLIKECDSATRELEQELLNFENEFAFAPNAQVWSDSNDARTDSDLKLVNSAAMATLGERCVLVGNMLRGDMDRNEESALPLLSVADELKLLKCRFRALVVLCRAFQAQHKALDGSLASTAPGAAGPRATGWRIAREAVVVAAKANEALDHAVALLAEAQTGKTGNSESTWRRAEESQFLRDAVVCKRLEAQTYIDFCHRYIHDDAWEGQLTALASCFEFLRGLLGASAHVCLATSALRRASTPSHVALRIDETLAAMSSSQKKYLTSGAKPSFEKAMDCIRKHAVDVFELSYQADEMFEKFL